MKPNFFYKPDALVNTDDQLKKQKKAIIDLIETLSDPKLEETLKNSSLTKKDIVDLVFDRGILSGVSKGPKEELRSKFYKAHT